MYDDGAEVLLTSTRVGLSNDFDNTVDWNDNEPTEATTEQETSYRAILVAGPIEKGKELAAKVNNREELTIGCTAFEKIRFGLLPQLSALFLSIVIYRFDMNLRDASVLGLVGAGGIGAPLIFAMNSFRWSEVGSLLIGLVVLILIVEYVSNKIRTKLVRG